MNEREDDSNKNNLSEKNILWLSDLSKKDIPIAGGKGANLSEMYNAGLRVPNAFILTSKAFDRFINQTNLKKRILEILGSISYENTQDLENKTKQVRAMILVSDFPEELAKEIREAYSFFDEEDENAIIRKKFVAVRSSATTEDLSTASFAGQQETFLNIRGEKDLLENIKKCWASLYTARAVYYRNKNNFSNETSLIAVVIQKMVDSEKSGVMFTVNPLTNNNTELVIEGVFGLGEGIVSGTVEPDTYILNKNSGELKNKRIGTKKVMFIKNNYGKTEIKNIDLGMQEKEVLTFQELNELYTQGLKIEEHYSWPQDIEFAIEKGEVYIVQSRPITTLEKEDKKEIGVTENEILLKGLGASRGIASGVVRVIYDLNQLNKIQEGDILVTKMTNPDMVVTMQKSKAIVTDEGGMTCHAAIVSRELGIPCIVGTKIATKTLKDGQIITIDGGAGIVYEGEIIVQEKIEEKKENSLANEEAEKINEEIEETNEIEEISQELEQIAEINIPQNQINNLSINEKTKVKVNCDLPYVAKRAAATGADGIGLVRLEFIIAQSGIHPAEYIKDNRMTDYTIVLVNGLKEIAEEFKDKPIWVRTSDIRTDEYKTLKGAENEPKESNPMLGWHGIRRGLDQNEILKSELRAIKELHNLGYTNVGIMFPFVINTKEIIKAKIFMKEVGLDLEKTDYGVMIETPASCWIIEELCNQGIKFISFGTNDLTQLTLGIDRNNERLADLYSEMHPAMKTQIQHVIQVCKKHGVKTSICGQAGSNEDMAKFLVEQGISSISANIDAVSLVRKVVDEYYEGK